MASEEVSLNMEKPLLVLVDDENDILELYESLFSDKYEVKTYNNPMLFLDALRTRQLTGIDALISDLKMPQMTGIDMLKQAQVEGYFFPAILLSGNLDKDSAVKAVDTGVMKLLEKPAKLDEIMRTLDLVMVEHEMHTTRREIRQIIDQLRELYLGVRMSLMQYLPPEVVESSIVGVDDNKNVSEVSGFDELMDQLESRLDELLSTEESMEQKRPQRFRIRPR